MLAGLAKLADLTHEADLAFSCPAPALRLVCAAAMGATALLAVAVASLQPLGPPALRPPPLALVRPAVRPASRWRPLECMAGSFAVGDRVRVATSITKMHIPGHKDGLDVEGMVGEVIRVYDPTAPGQLSANYEIKVQFTEPKPWIAHFAPDELSAA